MKIPPRRVLMFERLRGDVCMFVRVNNYQGKMSEPKECWGEEEEVSGRQGRKLGGGEGLGMK